MPVVFEASPYYAGTGDASNWPVDHEVGFPPAARAPQEWFAGTDTSPNISNSHESAWLPRGFAVVHAETAGTGHSDGCPTSGAPNETLSTTAVIDWLNGRTKAYTTRTGTIEAAPADWHNGRTGMIGTSYNGTLPIGAATTGVEGLAAIVPISAISDWYDYYRANGLVRAPHQANGGNGNNVFQGEDLDVLADLVYSRQDEGNPRTICRPVIDELIAREDRATGDRSAFWQERNYMKDADDIEAATLVAHGNGDFNVMTKQAAQLYESLKANGVPHMFYFHQGGHGGAPTDFLTNLWFTRYLWGHENGVENLAKSWVVRETATCPPRATTVVGDHANTATLTVASTAPFRVGYTLTIPQTNADGTITNTTRLITNVAGNTLTLATAVATAAGQRVAGGATVSLACNTGNPTPYPEWPDPATSTADVRLRAGARGPRAPHVGHRPRAAGQDRRRSQRDRHDRAQRGVLQRPRALPQSRADRQRPPQRDTHSLAERVVQQAEGEPLRIPRQPPANRQWHDPDARLDRPGEPQVRLRERACHAACVLPPERRHAGEGHDRAGRAPDRADGDVDRPRLHGASGAGHGSHDPSRRQLRVDPGRRG